MLIERNRTMYRKTNKESQLDIFSSIPNLLNGKSHDQYNDINHWNNQFRVQILRRIEEEDFRVLFSENMGAPNSSVSTLLGMMILKEAFGWSESQLYERCRFDLLVRSALGLFNMCDSLPVESTYYLLRKRINAYKKETGIDLIEEEFKKITKGQIIEFQVSGHSLRMDSKLISSNIAFYSRYEIIHQTLALFCKNLNNRTLLLLSVQENELIKVILKEEGNKVVYRNNKDEIALCMQSLGELIYKLLLITNQSANQYYQTLESVFKEQFRLTEAEKIEIRPKEEISAESVQSPHDPECGYRNKDQKPVKGYNYNVTETCDKEELSLITKIQVEKANTSDNDFLKPGIEQTKELLGHQVENVHADGAYNSQANQEYTNEDGINFYLTGLQGPIGRFDLNPIEDGLEVIDMQTNEKQIVTKLANGKWQIKVDNKYRYFTQQQIDSCLLRKSIKQTPPEIRKIRNNVEASIFQLCFYTRNNKTKYRGLLKQKMWATFRCLWINLVRIINFMKKQRSESVLQAKNVIYSTILWIICSINNLTKPNQRIFAFKYSLFLYVLPKY